ncbi:MAG: hypothetical protein IKK79_04040 [Spirochaetaceae bacterium]|nr:hypothetical protein [Spirochaetaceae bacterium]
MKSFTCVPFFIFSAIFIAVSLCGCSNTVPDLTSVEAVVVYEYSSVQEPPEQRLSVFTQSSADSARVMKIEVLHPEEQIQWDIAEPLILYNGSKVWAGSASLMPPYFGPIPQGNYTIKYTDLAGEITTGDFTLNYLEIPEISVEQPIFIDTSEEGASSSEEKASEPIRKLALYSEYDGKGSLLYFEKQNSGWKSFDDLSENYSEAKSLRICLDYPSKQVRYILPAQNFN